MEKLDGRLFVIRWKARFLGYREWHIEKLNGRLSLSDGKQKARFLGYIVSGI
jgi:hypothetical protein